VALSIILGQADKIFGVPVVGSGILPRLAEIVAEPGLRNVVIDMLPVTSIDATGLMTITELVDVLGLRGIGLSAAGRATEWRNWAAARGFGGRLVGTFPTLRKAVRKLSIRPARIDEQPTAQGDA